MKFYHIPPWVQKLFPQLVWRIKTQEKELYLTFDDGPSGQLTDWILEMLAQYNAKATFFCVGENLDKFPSYSALMKAGGHLVCNHTYNHVKGLNLSVDDYLDNINKCEAITRNKLFRPPYGRLKLSQMAWLIKKGYRIIMWDILSYDFDAGLDTETSLAQIKKHAAPGSIIVFHDNLKAAENLRYLLPETLKYFSSTGYTFRAL